MRCYNFKRAASGGNDRGTAAAATSWLFILNLVQSFTTTAAFSINGLPSFGSHFPPLRNRLQPTTKSNPISRITTTCLHQSTPLPSHYYLELLIEAAASDSPYPIGGDFAGLGATFNPSDGSFISIPQHLIPEALLEWGQEPKCLEMLVSEDFQDEVMVRNTITILPDTGCSIDNLETSKVTDKVDVSFLLREDDDTANSQPVVGLQYPVRDGDEIRLETIFGMGDSGMRMRVVIDVKPSSTVFGVLSPMVLALERRTSASSSGGVIADGGGLDGRTVSMLLGEELRSSKTFVEQEPFGPSSYENPETGLKHVNFPGNVGIAYGWRDDTWVLLISHVHGGKRRVVARIFSITGEDTVDFKLESWEESI